MRETYSYSLNNLYRAVQISKQAFHQRLDRCRNYESVRWQISFLAHKIRKDHPSMGVRDMYEKLHLTTLGRDAFEGICRQEGLFIERSKKWVKTTDSKGVTRFDNLTVGLQVTRMNQLWQSDITFFEVLGRFYFITLIQDAFTKVIVGHQTSSTLITEETTLAALKIAIKKYGGYNLKGLILHSDGGGQYYDKEFLALTRKHKLVNSMCRYPWENGMAERLNGVIKNNYLKHRKIKSFNSLVKEVDRSVSLYNNDKPHAKLKKRTPIEVEKELLPLQYQTKPTMTESLNAKPQSEGASSPNRLNQTKPRNRDVLSANTQIG